MSPVYYTDPSITLRSVPPPFDPLEAYSRYAYLRNLAGVERSRSIEDEIRRAQLADLQRERETTGAVRAAARGAVLPEGTYYRAAPGAERSSFDRAGFLQQLAQGAAPEQALGFQQQFAQQDAAQQAAALEQREKLSKLTKEQFELTEKFHNRVRNEVSRLLAVDPRYRPSGYVELRGQLVSDYPGAENIVPAEYPGDQWLLMQAQETETYKTILEQAKEERKAGREAVGVTTPFPPEVEAQKRRIATAGRRPTRDVSAIDSMVEGTATDALNRAKGDADAAIALVDRSPNVPLEHKQKVRQRIREKVRPGAGQRDRVSEILEGVPD